MQERIKNQTYIEKLESYFHPAFITMKSNQESKRYSVVGYVKMLEEMCKDRKIKIEREPFPITNNFIYIEDQQGVERCWRIYEETNHETYRIYYYNLITEICIYKTYRDLNNRLYYSQPIRIPEGVGRFSLTFIQEMFEEAIVHIINNAKEGDKKQ